MEVAAYLNRQLLAHLRVVLGAEHSLTPVDSWAALQTVVQERMADLVVADPVVNGRVDVTGLLTLAERFPSLPIVVYTMLTPGAIQATVQLARRGVEHVVLNRFDDEPRRFLELLERVPAHALADRMLQELAEPLAALPVTVYRAIEQLFRSPARFKSAQDLAVAAGMNSRTLYRNLQPVGLYSPRKLVAAARLLRAYVYLRDPGRSIKQIAAKAGYNSPWQFARQMRETTGLTPRRIRRSVSSREFVEALAKQLLNRTEEDMEDVAGADAGSTR